MLDKRIKNSTQSLLALKELLLDAKQNPAAYLENINLQQALSSQGALSKYSDESKGIHASSLNTIKRIAETLEGGFNALDDLRIGVFDAITKEKSKGNQSKRRDKIALEERVNELKKINQQLRQDMLLLTLAFEKSLAQGKNYALKANGDAILALCKREQRELLDSLSLRRHPVETNVTRLHED